MTSSNVLTTTFVETWPLRSWRFSHKKTFNDFIKEYNSLQTYVGKKLCVKEQQQRKAGDLWSNLGWELSVPEICVHQSSLRVRAYHFSVDENVTRISVRSCSSMQVKKHFTDINVPIFIQGTAPYGNTSHIFVERNVISAYFLQQNALWSLE